jgi:Ca2+-binding EF-hand superfamily protein
LGDADPEKLIRKMFEVFDKDKNGNVSGIFNIYVFWYDAAEEFSHLMKTLGESLTAEDIEDLIREVDENEDGEIGMFEKWELWNYQTRRSS